VGGTIRLRTGTRLSRAALVVLLATAAPGLCAGAARKQTTSQLKSAAEQFDTAKRQHAALDAIPESRRTLEEYEDLVKAYRKVYLITPRSPDVPIALLTVGDLCVKMGDRFDAKYYQAAVDAYQFLIHEYPTNRYREDALFVIGQIQKNDLKDPALARKTFEEFLQLHPNSRRTKDVQAAMAEIDASRRPAKQTAQQSQDKPAPAAQSPPAANPAASGNSDNTAANPVPMQVNSGEKFTEVMEEPSGNKIAEIREIKTWTTPDYTRIVISLDGPVKYQASRITNPERIYFDVSHAHLSHAVTSSPIHVQGELLKGVRVGQNQENVARIVLEVAKIKDYSVFLLRDPYRMVVDVYAKSVKPSSVMTANNAPPTTVPGKAQVKQTNPFVAPMTTGQNPVKTAAQQAAPPPPKTQNAAANNQTNDSAALKDNSPTKESAQEIAVDEALAKASTQGSATPPVPASANSTKQAVSADNDTATPSGHGLTSSNSPGPAINNKSLRTTGAKMPPTPVPTPTRDGQQSLTRALGLKIGKIVIDAGHGGHDTGTVGRNGLMEKDLCLDVALRLGKMIESKLPGAEIVYTRSDDTFVPLEERTAMANDAKADLFISIHANSSPDSSARGVETYYLNFSPSPEAMEVAARENATAQNNVHDLESMIQRIARNEKIEESRELAADIQDSLTKRLQRVNHNIKNRGVRKAPFVVLIGANMPSILAEISFISNPSDESSLTKPDGRERVAEGLYKGVETYLQATNSISSNQSKVSANGRPGVASTGNQR
jgi:N-acetylmuramoyl-L-alanine amidase